MILIINVMIDLLINSELKLYFDNKSLIVYFNYALLGFYLGYSFIALKEALIKNIFLIAILKEQF